MAKVKFDVSGSDPKDAFKGGGEQPKPGVYGGKIIQCKPGAKQGEPDNKRLEVVVEITDKKYKGSRLFDYISFNEASQWKMDQFLQVLGVTSKSKRKGTFDTDDVIGETVKVRVVGDTYNGEYRAKLAAYLMPRDDEDEDDEDDDDDVDVDSDDDDEIEDDDEENEDDEEESDDEDEDEDSEEEDEDDVPPYDEWDLADLKAECKARKLKIKEGSKKPTYVKALEADDEADSGDDEDDDEEPF